MLTLNAKKSNIEVNYELNSISLKLIQSLVNLGISFDSKLLARGPIEKKY